MSSGARSGSIVPCCLISRVFGLVGPRSTRFGLSFIFDVIRTDRNRACSKCTTLKSSRSFLSCSTSPLARYSVSTAIQVQCPRLNSLNHSPRNGQDLSTSQGLRQGPECLREQPHHGPHQPGGRRHPSQIRQGYHLALWRLQRLRARVQMTLHPPRLLGQSRDYVVCCLKIYTLCAYSNGIFSI